MNIFSYSIKRSDREELEHGLGKRLSDVEYNSIVNSVTSLKENLGKIDLASILSPTETEAPKKPVEEETPKKPVEEETPIQIKGEMQNPSSIEINQFKSSPKIANAYNSKDANVLTLENPKSSRFVNNTPSGTSKRLGLNTTDGNIFRNSSGNDNSPRRLYNKYVSENQNWEEKYLKYKNKYLSLKQKMEN
jgi:hypothetical protein